MKKGTLFVLVIGLSLLISAAVLPPAFCQEDEPEVPKGLEVKTKKQYKYVKVDGKLEKKLKEKRVSRYDKKGREIEKTDYDSEGNRTGRSTYEYDAAGNRILSKGYNKDGKLTSRSVHKFEANGKRSEDLFNRCLLGLRLQLPQAVEEFGDAPSGSFGLCRSRGVRRLWRCVAHARYSSASRP